MDKEKAIILVKEYAEEVLKNLSPEQIVLFGSYATNTFRETSDIDVAVIFNGFDGNFWEDSTLLWMLTMKINTLIEPILLDKIHDQSGFVRHILKTGIIVYQK
ncbi:MAG: nucleotidyltransferase domain-containing protein [Deltaproteobacteria bacterium]|jgi:predicted nucleotidyltransferase|nr:nucleotidyltransferase domain-containing protein [Deltaproteobacteria bacterium]